MKRYCFAFPGNESVAEELTASGYLEIPAWTYRHFPDGESYLRVETDVKGCEAVVICSLHEPESKAMPLLFLARLLRDMGAAKVSLLAPYLAYMRQDVSFHATEAVAARYFAGLLSPYFDEIITVDPHLHRIHALSEVYTCRTVVVEAAPYIGRWIKTHINNPFILGPDEESEQWAAEVAKYCEAPYTVLTKQRFGDRSVQVSVPELALFAGKTPVLIDDIISTGRTMLAAIAQLKAQGMSGMYCIGVHAVFSGDAYELLSQTGARIITCNTIAHPSNGINIPFAEAIS